MDSSRLNAHLARLCSHAWKGVGLAALLIGCSAPDPAELCLHMREISGHDTSNIADREARLRSCVARFTQAREQNPDGYDGFATCLMEIHERNDSTDNRIEGCQDRFPIE